MVPGGQYITCARAHNRPTFVCGSGPGLGFIAVGAKTVHFATANLHRSDGSGPRLRRWCVLSKLVYTATYVCTLIYITLLHSLAT